MLERGATLLTVPYGVRDILAHRKWGILWVASLLFGLVVIAVVVVAAAAATVVVVVVLVVVAVMFSFYLGVLACGSKKPVVADHKLLRVAEP